MALLHQLAHAVSAEKVDKILAFEISDRLPSPETAFGWENVFFKHPQVAFRNADSYAYIGLWARLADWGFTLSRDSAKNIEKGFMCYYSDITK